MSEHNSELGREPVREPLAIIGIGCEFPGGATDPRTFWDLLSNGVDATREVPEDRFEVRKFYDPDPAKTGKMNTFRGGFLDRIDQFDAQFFGISPREAMWLDPQQRLLLQVAWEALEDGGQVADRLTGSDTGVFMGGFTLDYQLLQNSGVYSRYHLHTHSATGMMMTMLANRLSYVFDFRGPSLTVDTACSGSLVAVHLAAQSLWNGECSMALAGGVNVMIAPNMTIAESKGGFLSPDGRCKTFDASANGYARGEGAGVVVLKSIARAQADGDPVYALIRGTAVSQDGHTNGITVPNQDAQESAMRTAYRRAGIAPHQVQYVEAHGTGTPVGDPIEARAIGAVLSEGRAPDEVCVVGSVKTNIGHLEAAAGIAGLTKVALALSHRQIPPHLNLRNPNPEIDFATLRLRVPSELDAWPATDSGRFAGVNSFGFGGTNAHVVLEEAPPERDPIARSVKPERRYLLPLSARSPEALTALAGSYRDFLTSGEHDLNDVGYSASLRRSHHEHRLSIVAQTPAEAGERLEEFLAGKPDRSTSAGRPPAAGRPKIAFVCSGMGPQWWAMGRELIEGEPIFRAAIERCDAELSHYTDWSLLDAMCAPEAESRMAETEVAQTANFAIQIGLAELWKSWGIEPDAVIGHSTGEVAAQYLTGALSFEDAVKVNYYRSSLQQRTTGSGRMLAVGMTPETLEQAVADAGPLVSVAAVNSPSAVTLSGDAEVLEDIAAQLETFGVFHRFLQVKVPYHSHFMDPLRDDLLAGLADLTPRRTSIPLYSTVTGTRIDGTGVGAEYWWQNVRATVLFEAAFTQMIDDGYTVFVELSPHPVLAGPMNELLSAAADANSDRVVVPSLRRDDSDLRVMLGSLGTLYTRRCDVSWPKFYDEDSNFVRLPGYPWQLKAHWTESAEAREDRHFAPVHPLLGQRMNATHPTWEVEVDIGQLPYLADHRIQGTVLLPGAAFVEMALAAAVEVYGDGDYALEDLAFRKALVFADNADPRLRTIVDRERATVEISSYNPIPDGEARWTLHATARLCQRQPTRGNADPATLRAGCEVRVEHEEFYERTERMGFGYGPAFQTVQEVYAGPGAAYALIHAPEMVREDLEAYAFHPALIDAAFQVLIVAAGASTDGEPEPYLPVALDRVRILGRPVEQMLVRAEIVTADERTVVSNLWIFDETGRLLVEIEGFRAQSLEASLNVAPERIDKSLYELDWLALPREEAEELAQKAPPEPGDWLIFTDAGGVGAALAQRLTAQGERVVSVAHGEVSDLAGGPESFVLDATNAEHYGALFARLAEQKPIARVLHLWSLDSAFTDTEPLGVLDQDQQLGSLSVVHLMQAMSLSGATPSPHVWLATRRAQSVGEEPGPVAVAQAPLWGLGRVIGHQEFTSIWGGLIDLDTAPVGKQAEWLHDEITSGSGEDQVAFRDGQRYVARLTAATSLTAPLPPSLRADGSYVVTGGLGSLGLLVARFLIQRGARRLILMGRTAVPERASWHEMSADHPQRGLIDELLELEGLGATLHLVAADVGDEAELASWLSDYERASWPAIRGVVHTAGVVEDELLLRISTETFERVLRPKVRGGWLLHQLLGEQPLDFFVLFSSTGSVIASMGQGNYAAGNAFLDALAHHRRALGLPAISIGWGPWSVGMVVELGLEQFYAKRGIELFTPDTGIQILSRVLGQRPAQLTAITVDWEKARNAAPTMLPPMFSLLGNPHESDAADSEHEGLPLLGQLAGVPAGERSVVVAAHLHDVAALVLGLEPSAFGEQESLSALGLDSMMAIEVKHRIEAALPLDISVLELLQGVSVAGLTDRVLSSLQFEPSDPGPGPAAPDDGVPTGDEDDPSLAEIERLIAQSTSADLEELLRELEQETT